MDNAFLLSACSDLTVILAAGIFFIIKMAGHIVIFFNFLPFRFILCTGFHGMPAARPENTPAWRIGRARQFSLKNDTLSPVFNIGIRYRNS